MEVKEVCSGGLIYIVGNGKKTRFWKDLVWKLPFEDRFP
jgi:hypothetical protein